MEFFDYVIEFTDGAGKRVEFVTREHVTDRVLSLHKKENNYGLREEHLGSWPLIGVREWRRSRR